MDRVRPTIAHLLGHICSAMSMGEGGDPVALLPQFQLGSPEKTHPVQASVPSIDMRKDHAHLAELGVWQAPSCGTSRIRLSKVSVIPHVQLSRRCNIISPAPRTSKALGSFPTAGWGDRI